MSVIANIIISDSTCDISKEDQARFNIEVIPLTVHFDGTSYLDGVDITPEQFYQKLEQSEKLPTTSQIPPQTFVDIFKRHLDAGDDVVGIFISGDISGTYNSACVAKQMLGSDRLHIVDSRIGAMGLALLVIEAAKYRELGHSASQITEYVTGLIKKVRFLAVVNTLKYLRKGGRISAATAIIGEMLGMKPIVSVVDGSVQPLGKARGLSAAFDVMLQKYMPNLPDLRYEVIFGHSCAPDLLEKTVNYFKGPLNVSDYLTCSIGSVIGTYSGRGAVGLAYIAK